MPIMVGTKETLVPKGSNSDEEFASSTGDSGHMDPSMSSGESLGAYRGNDSGINDSHICLIETDEQEEDTRDTYNADCGDKMDNGSSHHTQDIEHFVPRKKMSLMEEENCRDRLRMLLIKECRKDFHEKNNGKYDKSSFRKACSDEDFLARLFLLFDHDRDGYLVQDKWIEFLKIRLSQEQEHNFAEIIETVSYILCGDDDITPDIFAKIFTSKGVLDKLFRVLEKDSDGIVTADQIMDFIANLSNARTHTSLTKENVEWLEKLFRQTVGDDGEIHMDSFKKIVQSKNPFFVERVFQVFDKDGSGTVCLQEFVDAMHQFSGQTPDDKIKFLFKVYDLDGDGLIQQRELQDVMTACMLENGMKFSDEQIEDLTVALFEDADVEHTGAITYESLKAQLLKHHGLLENLSISIDRWLVPPKPKEKPKSVVEKLMTVLHPYHMTLPYLKNNYVYLTFLMAYLAINLGLFISRAIEYKHTNGFVILARACGQCLNFNGMFILVLMLRNCITFLRSHGMGSYLPLDHHIYFHKMAGWFIFFYSVLHTVMHICNFTLNVIHVPVIPLGDNVTLVNEFTPAEWFFTAKPGLFGLIPGWANITGWLLLLILFVMVICSLPYVRKGGYFEVFYWTHLLFVAFWILLFFHGPNFWKWFIGPGLIFIIEKIVRYVQSRTGKGMTYISSGILLPSRVTHLVIKRPPTFDFHPGDYVFVNIPAIAKYEWHPFTISSAPEQMDMIWLHIRAVGQWTKGLYEHFEKQQKELEATVTEVPVKKCGFNKEIIKICSDTEGQKTKERSQKKSVLFAKDGITNEGYIPAEEDTEFPMEPIKEEQAEGYKDLEVLEERHIMKSGSKKFVPVIARKIPLTKTKSLPDMDSREKKRKKMLVLRQQIRSESDRSFDDSIMKRARQQALEYSLYKNPANVSLAKSFRYMRHKPTIIALEAPRMEDTFINTTTAPEKDMEEGNSPVDAIVEEKNTEHQEFPVGKPLEVYIDGPYGAPSSHIFRAQHAVLIGTGIGVTPFASILQSIMHRYWKARHTCPKCSYSWTAEIPDSVMYLRKVDFFWINRDQRSFEWFVNLLSQLEIEQAEQGGCMDHFLNMHMYITSALQKTDMKAVGLQLALDLLHQKEKRDLITGLKTRTIAGRPNWDKVFRQIQSQKKGRITVFYCGPPQLGRILRFKCDEFGFLFRKESF